MRSSAARSISASVGALRYVIPRTFDRVMAFPHLLFPLSRKLEMLAPEVFLPGVGVLPNDFIMAVKTNPRFVEALMLGANHEMGREMLWQGCPPDQRGTPFQQFWQRLDGKNDIEPIHSGTPSPLGAQPGEHRNAGAADSRSAARALPEPVDLRVPDRRAARSARAAQSAAAAGVVDRRKWIRPRRSLPVMRGHLEQGHHATSAFPILPVDIDEVLLHRRGAHDRAALRLRRTDRQWRRQRHAGRTSTGSNRRRQRQLLRQSPTCKSASPAATRPRWDDPHAATSSPTHCCSGRSAAIGSGARVEDAGAD